MNLTRNEIETALKKWNQAWDHHDLQGVMALFHAEVYLTTGQGVSCGERGASKGLGPLVCQPWRVQVYRRGNLRGCRPAEGSLPLAA